jgi:[acyl-carrier-protein] S-malonyltransferase
MADSVIVLCPGQGAQFVGMGRAWSERSPEAMAVFAAADAVLAADAEAPPALPSLSGVCFEGPEGELNRTDISQPAIFTASIACWRGVLATRGLGENDIRLRATAGLSLGEYTALTIAGALSFEDGLRLVALRGRAMQDAAAATPSGMVAIIGADDAEAMALCEEARGGDILVGANFNAPGQVVLSGTLAACERAVKLAAEKGLRASQLPVAGAFHSPLMQSAAERLAKALAAVEIRPPRCPVYSNVTAGPHETAPERARGARPDLPFAHLPFADLRARLVEQLTAPVRWSQQCRNMIEDLGGSTDSATGAASRADSWQSGWIELAPGRTLAGLMRRIDRSVKVENFDEP